MGQHLMKNNQKFKLQKCLELKMFSQKIVAPGKFCGLIQGSTCAA